MIRSSVFVLSAVLCLAGLFAAPVDAQHGVCYPAAATYAPAHVQTYATPIYATELRFQTIFLPTYVLGKTEASPAAATAPADSKVTEALERNTRALAELLKRLPGETSLPPAAAASAAPIGTTESHLRVFLARCASCHDKAIAGSKGAGFAFLDRGKLAEISDRDINRIVRATYRGTMPKGGKLSDEEFAAIMAWDPEPALR